MAFLTWLPDALAFLGMDVYVMPGAETRSTWSSGFTVKGVVWHHTVTGLNWSDGHVAFLLRDGRRDLSGPLSQVGVERDGTIVIVAMGRANHNGYGLWGNDAVGIEFYNDGYDEPLTKAQVDAGLLLTAVILGHEGLGVDRCKAHRETDPGRKVDVRMDMNPVREGVQWLMDVAASGGGTAPAAQPATTTTPAPAPAPAPVRPAPSTGVCDVKVRVLSQDMQGGDVKSLQILLNEKASQGLKVDGDFGGKTDAAVRNVQRFFGVEDDGIVGPVTWGLLFL